MLHVVPDLVRHLPHIDGPVEEFTQGKDEGFRLLRAVVPDEEFLDVAELGLHHAVVRAHHRRAQDEQGGSEVPGGRAAGGGPAAALGSGGRFDAQGRIREHLPEGEAEDAADGAAEGPTDCPADPRDEAAHARSA